MLRADTLKLIQDTTLKAATAQVLELPSNRVGVVIGGNLTEYDKGELVRRDTVGTVASFVLWCNSIADSTDDVDVWVSGESLEAVCSATLPHLAHRVVMDLKKSAQVEALESIGRGMPPTALVRVLRTVLAGCFNSNLLPTFRQIDFNRSNQTRENVKHTGGSFGRSVEMLAQSTAGEIPETVLLTVPVWAFENAPRATIECAVECESERGVVTWLPTGDGIAGAIRAAKSELAETLRASLEDLDSGRVFVR